MKYNFPIPKDNDDLCKLMEFVDNKHKEIDQNIYSLNKANKFGGGHIDIPGARVAVSYIIAYMEYFNK